MNQYDYGKSQETILFEILKETFPSLERTIGKYDDWDYFDETLKYKIELKSRRINSNSYDSTIIGSNKIFKGKKEKKKGYKILYIFNYLDDIVYYRLRTKDEFRQAYFNDKYHTFIPKNKLKKFLKIKI